MIEIKGLYKSYGSKNVLSGINLTLEDEKIYGILGRNGVAKSTLLRLISAQIKANKGSLELDGQQIYENARALSDLCMIGETRTSVGDMKVQAIFDAARMLYKNWDEKYKDELVGRFKLEVKKKYKKLSRGSQTMAGLIIGLASRARYTIFDEPSLGLDAAHRDLFYQLILEDWERYPRTIIISTHLIDEVTNLFEEVIILKEENILLQEEVPDLMERAHYLIGRKEQILSLADSGQFLNFEHFGSSSVRAALFGPLDAKLEKELKENQVDISPMPLQKLFIYLTEDQAEGEVM